MADEFARIARIAAVLGSPRAGIELSIGDDAAVLAPSTERTVVTVDAAIEGVHFRRDWMTAADIGYRATVAAASDVLAMGGVPRAAVAAWTIPDELDDDTLAEIATGQRDAAALLGLSIVGGNISSAPFLSITTTVLGEVARPIPRGGARPGQRVVLVGIVGEAALGIAALGVGREIAAARAYRRPPVLREESRALARMASAMIDVSDGLAQDLGHMALASGVRIVIDAAALAAARNPVSAADALALGLDLAAFELAGGDDYALVATVDVDVPDARVIGFVEAGEGVEVLREGARFKAPAGYVHGAAR